MVTITVPDKWQYKYFCQSPQTRLGNIPVCPFSSQHHLHYWLTLHRMFQIRLYIQKTNRLYKISNDWNHAWNFQRGDTRSCILAELLQTTPQLTHTSTSTNFRRPPTSTDFHRRPPTSADLRPPLTSDLRWPPPTSTDLHRPPPTSDLRRLPPTSSDLRRLPTSADLRWPPPSSNDLRRLPTSADFHRPPPTSDLRRLPPTSADFRHPPTSADLHQPPPFLPPQR